MTVTMLLVLAGLLVAAAAGFAGVVIGVCVGCGQMLQLDGSGYRDPRRPLIELEWVSDTPVAVRQSGDVREVTRWLDAVREGAVIRA